MKKWVIFGAGNYLSDIFDIIYATNGKVYAVVTNVPLSNAEHDAVMRRIKLINYPIHVVDIGNFHPENDFSYTFGFLQQRGQALLEIKKSFNIKFSALVHPLAHLGSNVNLGEGVIISPNVVIAPNVTIGDFCVLNRCVSIGHDTTCASFVTLQPRATIAGLVTIGSNTAINISATVIDRIKIGANAIVGAGAVVVKDVPDNVVVFGVPAKIVRQNLR
jgi:sugar O-acyltransferase (sialic acid O-acetyltransferase NeuD family)